MRHHFIVVLVLLLLPFSLGAQEGIDAAQKSPAAGERRTVAVFGSSVAAGWVTSRAARYDMENGWAWRLARLLEPEGYRVENLSVPGDDTAALLARIDGHIADVEPDFAIIALSLSNEGLGRENGESVFASFEQGMGRIIEKCRAEGIRPIVGACYPCDAYEASDYDFLKRMNLLENKWKVPLINFLGAVDDGHGHFPAGYTYDESHPDNRGHEEMFYAVVPTLFAALDAGKVAPGKLQRSGFTTLADETDCRPISFVPGQVMHSFTFGFSLRTRGKGLVAAIGAGESEVWLEIRETGRLVYRSATGKTIEFGPAVADGAWHDLVLSHRHLEGESLLFVDGAFRFRVDERLTPREFVLAGPGDGRGPQAPRSADYRDLLVYRSSLNRDEVAALRTGTMLSGSLEIYAPLDAAGRKPEPNRPVENLAQSLSEALAYRSDAASALEAIEAAIAGAALSRTNEMVVVEKRPRKLGTDALDACCGKYEVAPGFCFEVFREGEALFVKTPGQPEAELLAETELKFFIKFPLEEITFTFVKNDDGEVARLLFAVGEETTPATKIE